MEEVNIKPALCKHALLIVLTGESDNNALYHYLTGKGTIKPEQDIRFEYSLSHGRTLALDNLKYDSIYTFLYLDRFEHPTKESMRNFYIGLMYLLEKMNRMPMLVKIDNGSLTYSIDVNKFQDFADGLTKELLSDQQAFWLHVHNAFYGEAQCR